MSTRVDEGRMVDSEEKLTFALLVPCVLPISISPPFASLVSRSWFYGPFDLEVSSSFIYCCYYVKKILLFILFICTGMCIIFVLIEVSLHECLSWRRFFRFVL